MPSPEVNSTSTASRITTITAVVALVGSLFGNWVQYRQLDQKNVELNQAQQKITAAENARHQCESLYDSQLEDLGGRKSALEQKLAEADDDNASGVTALAHVHGAGDIAYAQEEIKEAQVKHELLQRQIESLQGKIDSTRQAKTNCLISK